MSKAYSRLIETLLKANRAISWEMTIKFECALGMLVE